jgi:hypothetical protein
VLEDLQSHPDTPQGREKSFIFFQWHLHKQYKTFREYQYLQICFLQASQASQSEIASALGVSRPTAVKKIEQIAITMREAFRELEVEEEGRVRIFQAVLINIGAGILDGELTR